MPVFAMLLGRTMKIDPEARSSMWEDLQRGRRTEIDYLQGVIVEIAERRGLSVPLSRRIVALIKSAEAAGQESNRLTKRLAEADSGPDPFGPCEVLILGSITNVGIRDVATGSAL